MARESGKVKHACKVRSAASYVMPKARRGPAPPLFSLVLTCWRQRVAERPNVLLLPAVAADVRGPVAMPLSVSVPAPALAPVAVSVAVAIVWYGVGRYGPGG